MVKLIAFYEDQWMPPGTDRAQWQHLAGAFGAQFQMIRDWSEAVIPEGHAVIAVDEFGEHESGAWTHPEDAVYVFGRSGQNLMSTVPSDHQVKVTTPNAIAMFGISAGSIILRERQT